MSDLTSAERSRLRGAAHHLKPVVQIGKDGLSPGVVAEVDRSLEAHQLIKVRLAGDREEREEQARTLAEASESELVGTIGAVAILYRPLEEAPEEERSSRSSC
ncbi:MAG: ribosome assembly RNA-binding protein YhbY [Thermoanaerobaculia bacterium]|nr:ribosome assembly RNA-binding protein YhbY [Thermoanaerobaculia bacterium]